MLTPSSVRVYWTRGSIGDYCTRSDHLEVAAALPVGDGQPVLLDLPLAEGGVLLHELRAEPLAGEGALAEALQRLGQREGQRRRVRDLVSVAPGQRRRLQSL